MGLIVLPVPNRSMDVFVDASFAGEWVKGNEEQAKYDPNTARSRTGYLIMYAGVPLVWGSKLQTEVTLSSTEAEMVALSAATQEAIFLLRVIKDITRYSALDLNINGSRTLCKVHEDNQGTIAITEEYRIRPRTKHIKVKYWHFNKFMEEHQCIMSLHWIPSEKQLADIFTKPLNPELHH